jgi:hypothetical protein
VNPMTKRLAFLVEQALASKQHGWLWRLEPASFGYALDRSARLRAVRIASSGVDFRIRSSRSFSAVPIEWIFVDRDYIVGALQIWLTAGEGIRRRLK